MNLRDLRYLVAVADRRHFGRAADACHVSQPTLSTQLHKFEDYLGVKLVERSNRRVLMTPVGEELAGRARRILQESDELVAAARAARDPLAGEFRVGVIPTVGPYLLPHLLPALREAAPGLRPQLHEDKTDRLLARLHAGELDAVLLAVPVPADGLQQEVAFREPFVLAAPADHPLARCRSVRIAQLHDCPVLLLEEGHCLRDQALEVCGTVGAREAGEFRATSLETLRQMVASGAGVTLLPELAARVNGGIANGSDIAIRPFQAPAPSRDIAVLWRTGAAREAAARVLARCARGLPVLRTARGKSRSAGPAAR